MGLSSFPISCLTCGNPVLEYKGSMVGLLVSSRRTYANTRLPGPPCPHSRPLPAHISTEDPQTLTGRSGSVSSEVRAPFPWVVVHTKVCVCPPRVSVSPSPVEVLSSDPTGPQGQIPWGFPVPLLDSRLGSKKWSSELSQQWENFFGLIILLFFS